MRQPAGNTEGRVFSGAHLARILLQEFAACPGPGIVVAFSGGLDSSVLLHAVARTPELRDGAAAITGAHVNHGLHADADRWQELCARRCREWGVRFIAGRVKIDKDAGFGLEAAARRARYGWFDANLPAGSLLLTAHHRDDQAETVLGNVLRGAGMAGLRGIPAQQEMVFGRMLRPLLRFDRDALRRYALEHDLQWIEDPSNRDTRFTRNYLRRRVLPVIEKRWPRAQRSLARMADNVADATALAEEIARSDLEALDRRRDPPFFLIDAEQLSRLGSHRCMNALRAWLHGCGFSTPDRSHVQALRDRLVAGTMRASGIYRWRGVEFRYHKRWLYLSPPLTTPAPVPLHWDLNDPLRLPEYHTRLVARPVHGAGLRRDCLGDGVTVDWRRGGERCRVPGRGCTHRLSKLFQDAGVPPWQRKRIPLIYIDGSLAAVAGYWVCEPYAAGPGDAGVIIDRESID